MTDELFQKMLNSISSILRDSSLDEQFIELVLKRLESLSYAVKEDDTWMIGFAAQKVESTVKNSCNTSSIPAGLRFVAVDMVCGEFLYSKKQTGSLDDFDLEVAVKQVQAGDTNVTFAVGEGSASVEQRLDALFSYLINSGKGEFVCYRRVKW